MNTNPTASSSTTLRAGDHALATNLVGFPSSTLRVRITRKDPAAPRYVWVVTADLLDAGTALVLDTAQVVPEPVAEVVHHRAGLVTFEAGVVR